MTACCDICQHPACWKAEIDIRRSALRNEYGYFNSYGYENKSSLRYDARSECIVESDGSLPTYKTLDLLASGFPPSGDTSQLYEENVSRFHLPHLPIEETKHSPSSEGKDDQTFTLSGPVNKSLTNYIKKLCDRRIEVQKQEEHEAKKNLPSEKIFFKTLTIEDDESFGDEHAKVYTWVPGKKPKSKSADEASRETKVLALKMIDGADLPDCSLSDENKHRQRLQSQQAGYQCRRKTIPCNIQTLGTEDREEYMQLLQYLDLSSLKLNDVSMNNQDVRIPSPLQTARVKLYNASEEFKSPRHVPKPKHTTTETRSIDDLKPAEQNLDDSIPIRSKTMYIRNGVVLSKSPVTKMPENSKSRKRTPLPLTRVSVPKKVVRKLPLFDHCSSSIKKTDLPEVTMQPISSSENTSVTSLRSSGNPSLAGDIDLVHNDGLSSPDLTRVPPCSPLSIANESISLNAYPVRHEMKEYEIQSNDISDSPVSIQEETADLEKVETPLASPESKESTSSGKVLLNFEGKDQLCVNNTKVTPSSIMIQKASVIEQSANHKEQDVHTRQSPSTSLGSKGSLDGWLLDKDIISRTYDKYQSFTPFKSPQCSAHLLRDDMSDKSKRNNDSRMLSSRRQILPPSLHNLDQFLPGDDDSLKPNISFTTRCLSPSRSMFIRQQKQPPIEIVPSEITISRFPLLPAITKSQKSMRGDSSSQKTSDNGQPLPRTPRFAEEVNSCSIDGDYDEDVEEVLLNQEKFSSTDIFEFNDKPSTIHNELHISNTDTLNVNSMLVNTSISNGRNECISNSLNVNNGEVNNEDNVLIQPETSNFLLHSNQETNSAVVSPQSEGHYPSLPPATSNSTTNDTPCPSSPHLEEAVTIIESEKNLITSDESFAADVENIQLTNEHTSDDRLSSLGEIVNLVAEKNSVSEGNFEINLTEEYTVENHSGCITDTRTEQTGSEPSVDSMKSSTPSDDKFSYNSCIDVDGEDFESSEITSQTDQTDEVCYESNEANVSEPSQSTISKLYNLFNGDINSDSVIIDEGTANDHGVVESNENSVDLSDDAERKMEVLVNETTLDQPNHSNNVLSKTASVMGAGSSDLSTTGSRIFKTPSHHLVDDPVQSVMKDIFNNQIVQQSSLYLTPKHADDFMEGLDLDLELEEEIIRAMHGLEDFVVDNYEDDVESNKS